MLRSWLDDHFRLVGAFSLDPRGLELLGFHHSFFGSSHYGRDQTLHGDSRFRSDPLLVTTINLVAVVKWPALKLLQAGCL